MKISSLSLIISSIIHLIIFIILFITYRDRISSDHPLQINIAYPSLISQPEIEFPLQIQADDFLKKSGDPQQDNKQVNIFRFDYRFLMDSLYKSANPPSDTSAVLNQKEKDQFLTELLKKEYFLSEINLPAENDSQMTAFSMNKLHILQTEHDALGNTSGGVQPLLILEKMISFLQQQMDKENPPQLNFIPSETQLNIISILSDNDDATQLEIYSFLSSRPSVTMEILNKELDLLTYKGFLTRKKISPQLIFNFFGTPIEMSRKNQLNPIYRYTLNIKKQDLLSYLQSKYFLLGEELQVNPSDSSAIISEMNTLQEKIFLLFE